jgi:hypothetical protein
MMSYLSSSSIFDWRTLKTLLTGGKDFLSKGGGDGFWGEGLGVTTSFATGGFSAIGLATGSVRLGGLSCIEADPNLFSPAGDFVRSIPDQANLDLGSGLRLTSELYGSDGADDFAMGIFRSRCLSDLQLVVKE